MSLTADLNIRKLRSHESCVNAVAFSSNDGRWLGTGGDGLYTCALALEFIYTYELHYTPLRQETINMGLVAGRYRETRAHLPRSKCTRFLVASYNHQLTPLA